MRLMRKKGLNFNYGILGMIGRSYSDIKGVWGNTNGIYACGGEVGFLFGKTVFCYFTDEDNEMEREPKKGSVCYSAGCKFETCINGMKKRVYSFSELEEKLGIDIFSFTTDDEDEHGTGFAYTHEFSYEGLHFAFYSDSMHSVHSEGIVFVKAD